MHALGSHNHAAALPDARLLWRLGSVRVYRAHP